jgi:uncharacterized membrane protein
MRNRQSSHILAAGIGAIAGLRSMSAPALTSHFLANNPGGGSGPVTRLLSLSSTSAISRIMAVGEMIADKTPLVPSRTIPVSLAGRALMGGLCGAAIAERRGGSSLACGIIGASAAVGSAYAAFHLRQFLHDRFRIPQPILGLMEDGLIASAGTRLARQSFD